MNQFKKPRIWAIILLLALTPSQVLSQSKYTLTQAIDYAKKQNISIMNARLDVKDAEQEVKSIVATGLPQINANGSFMHNIEIPAQQLPDFISPAVYGVLIAENLLPEDRFQAGQPQTVQFGAPSTLTGSVTLNQLVFDGTYFLGLKAAKEYVNISTLTEEQTTIDVVENVTKAYFLALFSDRNLELIKQSRKNLQTVFDDTKKLYENGLAEKLDVDRLELSISNIDAQIKTIEASQILAYKSLKMQMGLSIETPIDLDPAEIDRAANQAVQTEGDLSNRVEYRMLDQAIRLDDMNIKRYKVGYIPSLGLQFQHQQNSFASAAEFDGLGDVWNPGTFYVLNLTVPIFDGFYKKAKVQQAKLQKQKDENLKKELDNALSMQRDQAILNYETQTANFDTRKKNKDLAASIFNQTRTKYDAGMGSSFELTQSESDMTMADIEYSNALYQLIVSKIELQKALGLIK